MYLYFQNNDIEIDIPPDNEIEIITEEEKINDVDLDDTSSEIKNWSSLLNDDLDTLIPKYDSISINKEKEQSESEIKLELEGKYLNYQTYYKCLTCVYISLVTLTPKIDDVSATTNQTPSDEPNDNNIKINDNDVEHQELPKTVSSPVIVEMPSVIQPLVITSSNSSPLPSTTLFMTPLLQKTSVIDSSMPKDFSFINTITNVPSSLPDRSVNHTYVSSIKSQVSIKFQ